MNLSEAGSFVGGPQGTMTPRPTRPDVKLNNCQGIGASSEHGSEATSAPPLLQQQQLQQQLQHPQLSTVAAAAAQRDPVPIAACQAADNEGVPLWSMPADAQLGGTPLSQGPRAQDAQRQATPGMDQEEGTGSLQQLQPTTPRMRSSNSVGVKSVTSEDTLAQQLKTLQHTKSMAAVTQASSEQEMAFRQDQLRRETFQVLRAAGGGASGGLAEALRRWPSPAPAKQSLPAQVEVVPGSPSSLAMQGAAELPMQSSPGSCGAQDLDEAVELTTVALDGPLCSDSRHSSAAVVRPRMQLPDVPRLQAPAAWEQPVDSAHGAQIGRASCRERV